MMPRIPNKSELKLWNRAVQDADALRDGMLVLSMMNQNAALSYQWGKDHDVATPSPKPLETRYLDLESRVDRLNQAIERVHNHTWGIRFAQGDIDIVDPSSEMSGIPLIVIGAVIIVGLSAAIYALTTEYTDLRRDYRVLDAATDKAFCKSGTPETCAEWKKYTDEAGIEQRRGFIDTITSGIGEAAKTGTKWGIGAAIPIALIALLWSQRAKR